MYVLVCLESTFSMFFSPCSSLAVPPYDVTESPIAPVVDASGHVLESAGPDVHPVYDAVAPDPGPVVGVDRSSAHSVIRIAEVRHGVVEDAPQSTGTVPHVVAGLVRRVSDHVD